MFIRVELPCSIVSICHLLKTNFGCLINHVLTCKVVTVTQCLLVIDEQTNQSMEVDNKQTKQRTAMLTMLLFDLADYRRSGDGASHLCRHTFH